MYLSGATLMAGKRIAFPFAPGEADHDRERTFPPSHDREQAPRRAYIDIEGDFDDVCEVAVIICCTKHDDVIILARNFLVRPINLHRFNDGRDYAHGMSLDILTEQGIPQEEIRPIIAQLLRINNVTQIIGNGKDIRDFIESCKINDLLIIDIPLPIWKDRVALQSHQLARQAKFQSRMICRCTCHFFTNHPHKIRAKNKFKREHRAHCSLYDALEVYLFHTKRDTLPSP